MKRWRRNPLQSPKEAGDKKAQMQHPYTVFSLMRDTPKGVRNPASTNMVDVVNVEQKMFELEAKGDMLPSDLPVPSLCARNALAPTSLPEQFKHCVSPLVSAPRRKQKVSNTFSRVIPFFRQYQGKVTDRGAERLLPSRRVWAISRKKLSLMFMTVTRRAWNRVKCCLAGTFLSIS